MARQTQARRHVPDPLPRAPTPAITGLAGEGGWPVVAIPSPRGFASGEPGCDAPFAQVIAGSPPPDPTARTTKGRVLLGIPRVPALTERVENSSPRARMGVGDHPALAAGSGQYWSELIVSPPAIVPGPQMTCIAGVGFIDPTEPPAQLTV